jgi:formylglycine-generating enzyme required for sulfatase activity
VAAAPGHLAIHDDHLAVVAEVELESVAGALLGVEVVDLGTGVAQVLLVGPCPAPSRRARDSPSSPVVPPSGAGAASGIARLDAGDTIGRFARNRGGVRPGSGRGEWTARALAPTPMTPTLTTLIGPSLLALVACGGGAAPEVPGMDLIGTQTFRCGGRTNELPVYRHGATGLEFVRVPGGTFTMGAAAGAAEPLAQAVPLRRVTVEPFLLARTEISNELFRRWKPEYDSGAVAGIDLNADELPAGAVAWTDAVAWCEAHGLRLPSEAEWEYACRAGTESTRFWGDGEAEAGRYANLADRALEGAAPDFVARARLVRGWSLAATDDGFAGTAPSGSFAPNAFGLFDMLGNVAEHCADSWHGTYAGAPATGRAWEDEAPASRGRPRVNRGAAWDSPFALVRCAWRGVSLTERGAAGVRPALSLTAEPRHPTPGKNR